MFIYGCEEPGTMDEVWYCTFADLKFGQYCMKFNYGKKKLFVLSLSGIAVGCLQITPI
jgi:hypothetical protein